VRTRLRLALVCAGLAALAMLAAMAWLMTRTPPSATPPLAVSVLAPPETRITGTPALSADGRALAFAALDAQGVARIWLRSFDGRDTRALAGTDGGDQPFWSPDSRSLGFFARGKLWTIDLKRGSPPRVLADASDPRGGTWSREDIIVFSPRPDGGLYRIAAGGGPALPLTALDRQSQQISHHWPRFLPDGRVILFVDRVATGAQLRHVLTAISIDGSGLKPLLDAASTGVYAGGRLLFQRAGKVFAQPFDAIELNLSGNPSLVADGVWDDRPGKADMIGFDAAAGVFASRPPAAGTDTGARVVHLLFNWPAFESK
jgi:hypothetical protein